MLLKVDMILLVELQIESYKYYNYLYYNGKRKRRIYIY